MFGPSPGIWFRFLSPLDVVLDTGLVLGLHSGIGLHLTADLRSFVCIIDLLAGPGVRFGSETAAVEV